MCVCLAKKAGPHTPDNVLHECTIAFDYKLYLCIRNNNDNDEFVLKTKVSE